MLKDEILVLKSYCSIPVKAEIITNIPKPSRCFLLSLTMAHFRLTMRLGASSVSGQCHGGTFAKPVVGVKTTRREPRARSHQILLPLQIRARVHNFRPLQMPVLPLQSEELLAALAAAINAYRRRL